MLAADAPTAPTAPAMMLAMLLIWSCRSLRACEREAYIPQPLELRVYLGDYSIRFERCRENIITDALPQCQRFQTHWTARDTAVACREPVVRLDQRLCANQRGHFLRTGRELRCLRESGQWMTQKEHEDRDAGKLVAVTGNTHFGSPLRGWLTG